MGYTIVSGNKPSSVVLHQNNAKVFKCIEMLLKINKIPNICSKSQYICQKPNGKVLKIPQLTTSLKLKTENFEYAL